MTAIAASKAALAEVITTRDHKTSMQAARQLFEP
jgi:hypothetical protein